MAEAVFEPRWTLSGRFFLPEPTAAPGQCATSTNLPENLAQSSPTVVNPILSLNSGREGSRKICMSYITTKVEKIATKVQIYCPKWSFNAKLPFWLPQIYVTVNLPFYLAQLELQAENATCIVSKVGHQVVSLALQDYLELLYWHYQFVLSWYLHQPESHQLSLHKVSESVKDNRTHRSDPRDPWVRWKVRFEAHRSNF